MTIDINADRALELLREAVQQRGAAFVYAPPTEDDDMCKYVHADDESGVREVGCGVGAALHAAGVPLDVLEDCDRRGGSIGALATLDVLRPAGVRLDDAAAQVLFAFQRHQDTGSSWGESLECATAVHASGNNCLHRLF